MPERAKRLYLCNLIPLWEIDEENVDVDWPVYHGYFAERIDLRAKVLERDIHWREDDGSPARDLKIRFEVYESDFLLSGGLNDRMVVISSREGYGDDAVVRPLKIVDDWADVRDDEKERFIFLLWTEPHEISVTVTAPDGRESTRTERVPKSLEARCWWRMQEEEDVSGHPEFYYDFHLEGRITGGAALELEERSDHELEGFAWNVTDQVERGRVTALVDGEYAYLKMLQVMDAAQHSIHVLNWKLDPQAQLALEHEFQGDYLQIDGLGPAEYRDLMVRNKPRVNGIAGRDGFAVYTLSNGNLAVALADGSSIVLGIQHRDAPTNLDMPWGVHVLSILSGVVHFLVLDRLRSRLVLFMVLPRAGLQPIHRGRDVGVFFARLSPTRVMPFFEMTPTFPAIMADPALVSGYLPLAGNGNPGYLDRGLATSGAITVPTGQLNRPYDVAHAADTVFISDTGNHVIRKIAGFDASDLGTVLGSSRLELRTLAGRAGASGAADGTAAARFSSPTGLAWDSTKSRLLVSDTGNRKLRAIDPGTGAVTTLAVTRIDGAAGTLGAVEGIAFDPARGSEGTLYVAEPERHRILAVDMDTLEARTLTGGAAGHADGPVAAARFRRPTGVAVDGDKLYVADSLNHVARVVDLVAGSVITLGSTTDPSETDVPVTLADLLRRKAEEGVKVRVVLDHYGSGTSREWIGNGSLIGISGEQTAADLRFLHSDIRAFVQPHEQTLMDRSLGSNHDKMAIVDGQIGFTGGLDFAPDKNDGILHDRKHRHSIFWHDVSAMVEGKAAHTLERHFGRRWAKLRAALLDADPSPEQLPIPDRTSDAIRDHTAESVRTYDRSPVIRVPGAEEVREILQSYRRAILAARDYVYMEHQYIYYPEIGDFIAKAMRDNRELQVIWLIPFFTEESQDPTVEQAQWERAGILADSITDTGALGDRRAGGSAGQIRSQLAWHGFFRQREMIDRFREIDANRFGVFSIQRMVTTRPDLSDARIEMIYPHSKMIMCDDRFLSIGSANANGRGFTKDGEHNVSAIAPDEGRRLRQRLWGEHLGFLGVADSVGGMLLPFTGHHLEPGARVTLRHPTIGAIEREVTGVDALGAVTFAGPPIPDLRRILWRDRRFDDLRPGWALRVWRNGAHKLATYRKVKGLDGRTDGSGRLLVPGHLAAVGDEVGFGGRMVLLNDDGSAVTRDPVLRPYVAGNAKVRAVTAGAIEFEPLELELPNAGFLASMSVGGTVVNDETRPFRVELLSRSAGKVKVRLTLAPNLDHVNFDYLVSWLRRQSGGAKWVKAWEIDPPRGIEYAGPGSFLFSPWVLPLWFLIDFDPDEQARLGVPLGDVRLA
jgi:phosphatidylserine/phosphatidylglycerophosphate/cardiolipin synthase-like enzyme